MAGADYYSCDVCESKAFYDAHLYYEQDKKIGTKYGKLDRVGDMKVICDDCAKKYRVAILKKKTNKEVK